MSEDFTGKVALVTGAAGGMGRATAQAFAAAGAKVVAADVAVDEGEQTVNLIRGNGGDAVFVRTDVSDASDVEAAVTTAVNEYGGLDCAANMAAIETETTLLADCEEATFDRLVAVNLRSIFLCLKYEIPLMLQHGGGAIVNTSSGAGVKGFKGQAAYAAAKHGVIGLTKSAALDYASQNIRINAVCPGIIETSMMQRFTGGTSEGRERVIAQEPVGRMGKPEEIGAAVVWLCSDAAAFVVGHAMVVDGGQTV